MAQAYRASGITLDPHTAVGVHAARAALKANPATPVVALATAHPAKFPDAVEAATGERPRLPAHLATILEKPERMSVLPNDAATVARFVRERARAAGRAAV